MDQIGSLLDRPKFYYNVDGVGELGVGFMCLSFALLQWLQLHSPEHSVWNRMYVLFAYCAGMSLVIHYGSKAIKNRITYPRTGFVEYRKRDTLWAPLAISLVFSSMASVALFFAIRSHWNITTPGSLLGLILAASYGYGFARAVRWKWIVAGAMTIASVIIAFLPPGLAGAPAEGSWAARLFPAPLIGAYLLSITLYGSMLLISGGLSFWFYLRDTQAPAQDGR